MTYKKHLYSAFAQTVFGKNKEILKMTALDFDIILYLIFHCSFEYDTKNNLSDTVLYTELKNILPSTPNTDSIKKSLLKIHQIEIKDNFLKSYGDKEHTVHIPFDIKILKDEHNHNKSHGFQVTADEAFMKLFTNPIPMVKLNYQNTSNLTTYASKKLYLLLKDALGVHKNQPRTIDIKEFEYLLNMPSANTSKSQIIAKIKEAIKAINKNTDIKVLSKTQYKLLLNGKKELDTIRFEITKQKLKAPKKIKTDEATDTVEEVETADDISKDIAFVKFVENKVQGQVNIRRNLKNPKGWAAKTKTILLKDDETIKEFNLIKFLEEQKDSLKNSIPNDSKDHMIVLGNDENNLTQYWVNSEYLIVDRNDGKIKTDNVYDTDMFIDDKLMDFYFWKIVPCNDIIKHKLVAF